MPHDQHLHDGRRSHAYGTDRADREAKARRIRAIVETRRPMAGADVLEVGTGAGWMAHHWSQVARSVVSVDVVDERLVTDDFEYRKVEGTGLPVEDDSVDVAISNHVLEHVGEEGAQRHHLRELRRVLRPSGVLYLAVPNRWRIVEPHYDLPLLSWLPQRLADRYLELTGKGSWYDVRPVSRREALTLFDECGLAAEDRTFEIPSLMRRHERLSPVQDLVARAPQRVLELGSPVVPTFVFVATVREDARDVQPSVA